MLAEKELRTFGIQQKKKKNMFGNLKRMLTPKHPFHISKVEISILNDS